MTYSKDSMYALQKLVEAHEAAIRWLQADPDAISASAMRDCLNAMMETMEIEKCSHCGEVVEQSEIEIDLCEQCTRGAAERAEDRAADLLAINTRGR